MVQFRRSKRRAVSLLEIIIGLPIVLILLLAVVQFGLLQSNQQTLKQASRAGALVAANMEIDGTETVVDPEIINAIDEVLRKGGLIDPSETIAMVGHVQLNYAVYDSGSMMPISAVIPMPATIVPPSPATYPNYHYVQVTISIPAQRLTPNAMACFGVDYTGRNVIMTSLYRHERSRINPIVGPQPLVVSMHWIGRSIVLLALLVIAAAIFWPDAWRSHRANQPNAPTAVGQGESPILPGLSSDMPSFSEDDNPHVSEMQNPLTRALDGMLASHGEVFKDSENGLRDQIEDADRRLTGIKSEIRSAMRNANRQVRVPGQNSPLVMMVVLEGVTKADLGFYGQPGKTPLLESLADHGTVFESCYAGPSVDIARFMLMTGSGHSKGKARNNFIADMIWNSGYHALLLDGTNWMTNYERRQYDEDVQVEIDEKNGLPTKLIFNDAEAKIVANLNETAEDDVTAIDLLVGQSRELLLHRPASHPVYVEFHFAVTESDPKARARQMAEIDQEVGRLFHAMHVARSGRSMAMVVAGLPAGNPLKGDGVLSESNLQVPLMIYRSHKSNVAKISEPCGLLDVLPTLADMISSSRVPRHNGISLLPWMDGKPMSSRRFRWSNPSDEDQFAIRQGPWKAIFGSSDQLFFLPDDPRETNNVAAQHPQVLEGLSNSGPNRTKMNFQSTLFMTQLHRRFDFLSKRARRGVSLLWIIIAFPALILFLVFAVEIGNIWLARLELEQSLEANALAAVKQWAESGGGDTLAARDIGNSFSIANPVRGQNVDLTDTMLNAEFVVGNNRLNYDDRGMGANPNQNLVCTNITDYNSYLQPGVMVFGAIIQTENPGNPAESVIFNADAIPSCAGPGSVLVDANSTGNLQNANNNRWGISFTAIGNMFPAQANLRIYRIDINVDPTDTLNYEFRGVPAVADTFSNDAVHGSGPSSGLTQPDNSLQEITTADIFFSIDTAFPHILTINFSDNTFPLDMIDPSVGLVPGDRFRFGAEVNDVTNPTSSSQVNGDDLGGVAEITIYYSYAGIPDSTEMGTLVDTMDSGAACGNGAYIYVDAIGQQHVIVHPTDTVDLPCPAASATGNNGQSYITIGRSDTGQTNYYAVRAQATIGVQSVVHSLCGFNLGPWGVSAKATAYYDCDTSDPKLIRVDVFQCDLVP